MACPGRKIRWSEHWSAPADGSSIPSRPTESHAPGLRPGGRHHLLPGSARPPARAPRLRPPARSPAPPCAVAPCAQGRFGVPGRHSIERPGDFRKRFLLFPLAPPALRSVGRPEPLRRRGTGRRARRGTRWDTGAAGRAGAAGPPAGRPGRRDPAPGPAPAPGEDRLPRRPSVRSRRIPPTRAAAPCLAARRPRFGAPPGCRTPKRPRGRVNSPLTEAGSPSTRVAAGVSAVERRPLLPELFVAEVLVCRTG